MDRLELRRRVIARVYDRVMRRYEGWIGPRRRELLAGLSGSVLELGPGTGANFAHLPGGVQWVGVEPNRHMHPRLQARALARGFQPELRPSRNGSLDLPSGSVDAVVATLVLCSVADPAGVLREIRRVLRPGGRLLFLEHVVAPEGTPARRWQRRLAPLWRFCTDGCTLGRDTGAYLRAAGFERLEVEAFEAPAHVAPSFVAPHLVGVAWKTNGGTGRAGRRPR